MTDVQISDLLSGLVGRDISEIQRVQYIGPDGITRPNGPVQLSFADGRHVLFDVGSDGEALRVTMNSWKDPFPQPISSENLQYLQRVGRWVSHDVSSVDPYASLVGKRTVSVSPIKAASGKVVGAIIATNVPSLLVEVKGDELTAQVCSGESEGRLP